MDGKRHFTECCNAKGLDCEKLFQLRSSNTNDIKRLVRRFDYLSRKETQIFAVCYFERENFYVAWSLKVKNAAKKCVFSVQRSSLNWPPKVNMITARKVIEYPGREEETVLAFTPEGVPDFLETYCKGL